MPDDPFKRFWNLTMAILLIYVVTYVPVSIAFIDKGDGGLMEKLDEIIDIIFICDFFL